MHINTVFDTNDGILKIQDQKLCIPIWLMNILMKNPFEDDSKTCNYFHYTLCSYALWFCVMFVVMLQWKEQREERRVLVLRNVDYEKTLFSITVLALFKLKAIALILLLTVMGSMVKCL